MKSFLNRLWPWRVILELQSTISRLTAALEKERQLHSDTKSENHAIKGELGIYQERASQHQRDARKMAQIIAIKGGIIGLFLFVSLSLVAQPTIRNPVTTNQLGSAINATYFLGWDALLSKPAWLVPVGPAVAQGTNILITTNAGVVTVNGLTDTNMINVFMAGPTNFALTIGANGTNNDNLHAANNTNFSLQIGANATNNDANSTNFSLLIGSNATNDDQLFGANATNHDWVIGANDTNQTWLIGANGTNNDTVVSNGVVAHTVNVAGTANQIAFTPAGPTTIAANPSFTGSIANPLLAPGPISASSYTNTGAFMSIDGLLYSWPATQTGGNLFDDGAGNLSWVAGTNVTIPNTITPTNFVLNTRYTNNSGSIQLLDATVALVSAAVSGNTSLSLYSDQSGGSSFSIQDQARITTLVTSLAATDSRNLIGAVSNNATYYFTNDSSGAGNSSSIVAGTGEIVTLADGSAAGVASASRTITVAGTANHITSSAGAQDLSANRAWTLDLATAGTAGTYRSVTTDAYGRVTAGTAPTTFSGYAISDTSANLAAALTDETGVGLAVFSGAPTTTNETIKGDQYGTNAFYIDAKGVTISNNVNQVKLTNGTVNASAGLLVGNNGFQVTTDGNQNYTGLWDRFVGAGSTLFGVTNSATETMIYSNVVPGHAIGTNGVLKVTVLGQTGWTTPNNATVNIRYGGAGGTIVGAFTYGTATTSTLRSEYQMRAIYNQNSESSQVSMTATTSTYTDSGGVVTTASFDTSTNFPLTITIKANGSVGTNTILAAEIEIKHKN